jgi:hypothetical protein
MTINLIAPRSWKELNERQLKYVSWLLTSRELTHTELHAHAFVRFTGIRILKKTEDTWICRHKKQTFTLTAGQALSFCKQMAWLTGPMGEITPLAHMAELSHVHARLAGTPFKQYIACENYYQAYIFTKKEHFLNCICACFYTSGNAFDDSLTADRSESFDKLPFHVRHTAFLWYYGLKTVLEKYFPHFFQRKELILDDDKPEAPNMRLIINNMIRALSGGDVTKTEAIYNAETWTALAELDAKALEYKEYERRVSKLTHKHHGI